VRVGPVVAADSYLNMEAVLAAIETTGAKAVSHDCPGDHRECDDNRVTFILFLLFLLPLLFS